MLKNHTLEEMFVAFTQTLKSLGVVNKVGKLMLVDDYKLATHIVHAGPFHADDTEATAAFLLRGEDVILCRVSSVPVDLNPGTIVFDIGGGKLDHHQKGGNGNRPFGKNTPYASFGLVWKQYYNDILKNFGCPDNLIRTVFQEVDRVLVEGVDGSDNGVPQFKGVSNYRALSVPHMVAMCNPLWDEEFGDSIDKAFYEAVCLSVFILSKTINSAIAKAKARGEVKKAIRESSSGVAILKRHMPWEEIVCHDLSEKGKNLLYVIYPTNRGGYGVQGVPNGLGSFQQRKSFPEEWRGQNPENLRRLTGINDIQFCHPSGFFAAAETLESAVKLAHIAAER